MSEQKTMSEQEALEQLHRSIKSLEEKFDKFSDSMNERFDKFSDSMNERFDKFSDSMNERFDRLNDSFDSLERTMDHASGSNLNRSFSNNSGGYSYSSAPPLDPRLGGKRLDSLRYYGSVDDSDVTPQNVGQSFWEP